jgi:hypothetical protein
MSRVIPVGREELETRRDEILARVDMSLDAIRNRAAAGTLLGDEWEAWDDLCDIEFLLGDD